MSINSLTNDELRRKRALGKPPAPKGLDYVAPGTALAARAATELAIQDNQVTITLNALAKYIPTEVVTLYVAAASSTPALRSAIPFIDARMVYWAFTVATPFLLLLLYASKRASDGMVVLPKFVDWPWWKMAAATIAFLVWALAVPGNPYVVGDAGAVIAGFGAIVISTFLSLLEPIFERPPAADSAPGVPAPVPVPPAGSPSPGAPPPNAG